MSNNQKEDQNKDQMEKQNNTPKEELNHSDMKEIQHKQKDKNKVKTPDIGEMNDKHSSKRNMKHMNSAENDSDRRNVIKSIGASIKGLSRKVKIMISGVIGAILIILVVMLLINRNTIYLSDYITIQYFGANGYAGADFVVDSEKLYQELSKNEKDMNKLTNYRKIADSLAASTDKQNISNGTVVPVTVSYDQEAVAEADLKLKSSHYNVRANGIKAGTKIDLYENISVTFAGISPDAYIVIDNQWDDEFLKGLTISANQYSQIKKGDNIVLNCDTPWEEIARHGYIVNNMQAEYKTDELSTYVENIQDIDRNMLQEMIKDDERTIETETQSKTFRMLYKATKDSTYLHQENDEKASNINLKDTYFLTRKDEVTNGADNYIYILYEADISNASETKTVYFAFEYSQGFLDHDLVFDIARENPHKRYTCYTSYDEMYDGVIGAKQNQYNITNYRDISQ